MRSFLRIAASTKLILILSLTNLLLNITQSFAQAGKLDSSFGVNGMVTTDFGAPEGTHGLATAVQTDGKILVAGYINQYSINTDFAIARYQINGNLDSTFGLNGKVITHFPIEGGQISSSAIFAIIIQPDGKIIAGGNLFRILSVPEYQTLARYLPNGNLDSSFGVNGLVTTFFFGPVELRGLILQDDGKILAGGTASNGSCLVRYKTNGKVDSSFGVNGKMLNNLGYMIYDLAKQNDGKLIAASSTGQFGSDFEVARLFVNGTFDSTFGNNGRVITDFNGNVDNPYTIGILSNNDIVVGGYSRNYNVTGSYVALVKYKSIGSIDSSFGTNGRLITKLGENEAYAGKILPQQDDKLIIAVPTNFKDFMCARFNLNGTIDSSFGINGRAIANFGTQANAYAAALQKDGKIIVAGSSYPLYQPLKFALARFKGDEPITVTIKKNISTPEGNSGTTPVTFKIILNKASTRTIKVKYTTQDKTSTAGLDYIATSGTLTFKPGQLSKDVVVNVIGDNVVELNEKFSLQLSNPQNAVLGTLSTATCTIKNDDPGFASSSADENISSINKNNIIIYPNPVKDVLRLEGLNANVESTISIVDLQGKVLIKTTASNFTCSLNVKQLPTGTYFVKVETGGCVTSIKFVKE